jgi:excisionase family DNA binding protein
MEDRLLQASEAARLLGISRRYAWLLGRRGVLPTVRVGKRQVRYSAIALRDWIASGGIPRDVMRNQLETGPQSGAAT